MLSSCRERWDWVFLILFLIVIESILLYIVWFQICLCDIKIFVYFTPFCLSYYTKTLLISPSIPKYQFKNLFIFPKEIQTTHFSNMSICVNMTDHVFDPSHRISQSNSCKSVNLSCRNSHSAPCETVYHLYHDHVATNKALFTVFLF